MFTAACTSHDGLRNLPVVSEAICGHMPFETLFVSLAYGHSLSGYVAHRLTLLDPPEAMLISQVGIAVLQAAVHHLKTLIHQLGQLSEAELNALVEEAQARADELRPETGSAAEPSSESAELEDDETNPLLHAERLADQTHAASMFVSTATQRFAASAAAAGGVLAASAIGVGAILGPGALLAAALASIAPLAMAAGVTYRAARERARRDAHARVLSLQSCVEKLEQMLEIIMTSGVRVGCPQFSGYTVTVPCPRVDGVALEPLTNFEELVKYHRDHLARLEARVLEDARGTDVHRVARVVLARALHDVFQQHIWRVDIFFDEAERRRNNYCSETADFDLGMTRMPATTLKKVGQGAAGVLLSPLVIVGGIVGALGTGLKAAFTFSKAPFLDYADFVVQGWRKFGTEQASFATYKDFAHFVASSLGYTGATDDIVMIEHFITTHFAGLQIAGLRHGTRVHWRTEVADLLTHWDELRLGGGLDKVPKQFRFALCCRFKMILAAHQLRITLSQQQIVGVFGTANVGKTMLMRKLLRADPRDRSLPLPGRAVAYRTNFPRIYSHPDNPDWLVLDTVGMRDDTENWQTFLASFMELCQIIVVLIPADDQQHHKVATGLLQLTRDPSKACSKYGHKPVLLCVNQADVLIESSPDDLPVETPEEVEHFVREWRTTLDSEVRERKNAHEPGDPEPCFHDLALRDEGQFPRWFTVFNPQHLPGRCIPQSLATLVRSSDDVVAWVTARRQLYDATYTPKIPPAASGTMPAPQ